MAYYFQCVNKKCKDYLMVSVGLTNDSVDVMCFFCKKKRSIPTLEYLQYFNITNLVK